MQSKKNEKVDLTKNSSLYFVIGLATILFISWQAIEWKT
ncbi:energy transducer TonB, partial [bacterium]|nr:energy transducer TonB [bacterium]